MKKTSDIKLTIIMPVFNGERYIKEAVSSIKNQTWSGERELIIVDDESTDNSFSIAKLLADDATSIVHGGAAKARNYGLKRASGQFVLFMDADDVLELDALEKLFNAIEGNRSCQLVYSKARDFISPELPIEQQQKIKPREAAYNGVLPGCCLIRQTVFTQVGVFDEGLSSGETIDWMIKVKEAAIEVCHIDHITLNRRIHMTNTGRLNRAEEMKNYANILRKRMLKQ